MNAGYRMIFKEFSIVFVILRQRFFRQFLIGHIMDVHDNARDIGIIQENFPRSGKIAYRAVFMNDAEQIGRKRLVILKNSLAVLS